MDIDDTIKIIKDIDPAKPALFVITRRDLLSLDEFETMTEQIEEALELFAPGSRALILPAGVKIMIANDSSFKNLETLLETDRGGESLCH